MDKILLVGDTHGYPVKIEDAPDSILIHLGDAEDSEIIGNCKLKILIRGNHDEDTVGKYYNDVFDMIVDNLVINNVYFSHEPAERLPKGCHLNIHGHLHDPSYSDYGYEQKSFHIRLIPHMVFILKDIRDAQIKHLMPSRVQ